MNVSIKAGEYRTYESKRAEINYYDMWLLKNTDWPEMCEKVMDLRSKAVGQLNEPS